MMIIVLIFVRVIEKILESLLDFIYEITKILFYIVISVGIFGLFIYFTTPKTAELYYLVDSLLPIYTFIFVTLLTIICNIIIRFESLEKKADESM